MDKVPKSAASPSSPTSAKYDSPFITRQYLIRSGMHPGMADLIIHNGLMDRMPYLGDTTKSADKK